MFDRHTDTTPFAALQACTVVAAAIIIVEDTREKGPGFFKVRLKLPSVTLAAGCVAAGRGVVPAAHVAAGATAQVLSLAAMRGDSCACFGDTVSWYCVLLWVRVIGRLLRGRSPEPTLQ